MKFTESEGHKANKKALNVYNSINWEYIWMYFSVNCRKCFSFGPELPTVHR